MARVLVLDGEQRSALAATRSLGQKGVEVLVASELKATLAGSSKYCSESLVYPSPHTEGARFIDFLRTELPRLNVKVIFPMTEVTTLELIKHKGELADYCIPFAEHDAFDALTDKWKLIERCSQLGVPAPKTWFIKSPNDINSAKDQFSYPVVIKPYRSRIKLNGVWVSTSVEYAESHHAFDKIISSRLYLMEAPFLVQEYIAGEGRGVFAVYNKGSKVASFAHRRIREKPPSGGVSVLSESILPSQKLVKYSDILLHSVDWHGVAMVEYKVTPDGKPFIIEVNARFWGSLQLAVDAGVDFPWILYQIAIGQNVPALHSYKTGVKCRWLLGDLDQLYLQLFKKYGNTSYTAKEKLMSVLSFLNFFDRNSRFEVNRLDDIKPFIFELKNYLLK